MQRRVSGSVIVGAEPTLVVLRCKPKRRSDCRLSRAKRSLGETISLLKTAPPKRQGGEALSQYASRVIRASIRAGGLTPGDRLREADVAAWLGISRTPVRE